MLLKKITESFEAFAPLQYQESYDNSGLQTGNPDMTISGALLCIDVTEKVVDEAITKGCNLIISHHPLIFGGIKKLTGSNYVERILLKAIKNDIALYAAHTNIDAVHTGVNRKIADKLALNNCRILSPLRNHLEKLVVFVPTAQAQQVRQAIFDAEAGSIGNYDSCSFNVHGNGSFKGNEHTNSFVGEKETLHFEEEVRIETIYPKHLRNKIVTAMKAAHPYEEVAFDVYSTENELNTVGAGMIGLLPEPVDSIVFMQKLKNIFHAQCIKHTEIGTKSIQKVALCGGSGSFLLPDAIRHGADIFVSADFKYHQFFDADQKLIIADIGHYESEQFTKEIFYDILIKKFPKFAVHFSAINTNPINYA